MYIYVVLPFNHVPKSKPLAGKGLRAFLPPHLPTQKPGNMRVLFAIFFDKKTAQLRGISTQNKINKCGYSPFVIEPSSITMSDDSSSGWASRALVGITRSILVMSFSCGSSAGVLMPR